jgi:hypothetical protein
MKKTTTKTEEKTSAKRSGEKKTGEKVKAFNGFKTEGPKTTKKKKAERILIDVSSYPKDEDGHAIVPREFMEEHYKELPDGTRTEEGIRVYNGGMLKQLGADPERDREIRQQGGRALQAKLQQRRTLAESIEIALRKKARAEDINRYNLPDDATNQDVITAAIVAQAGGGNMKAWTALRDTVGEMPVARTEITADVMTAADRALVEKLSRRLDSQ